MKLPICQFIILLFLIQNAQSSEHQCKHLKEAFYREPPISVGLFNSTSRLLLFVRNDEHELSLHNLSLNSLQNDSLYYDDNNCQPVNVQQKFPWLFARYSDYFKYDPDDCDFGLTSFVDEWNNEFLLFVKPNWYQFESQSLIYDLSTNKEIYSTWKYAVAKMPNDDKILGTNWPRLIAASEPNRFYQFVFIQRQQGTKFTFDHVMVQFEIKFNQTEFHQVGQYLYLCINDDDLIVKFSYSHCANWLFINWFRNGFFREGKLYLFGMEEVMIIPEVAINNAEVQYSYEKIRYRDWIVCEEEEQSKMSLNCNQTQIDNNSNSKSNGKMFSVTIIIALVLIAVFVVVIIFLYRRRPYRAI